MPGALGRPGQPPAIGRVVGDHRDHRPDGRAERLQRQLGVGATEPSTSAHGTPSPDADRRCSSVSASDALTPVTAVLHNASRWLPDSAGRRCVAADPAAGDRHRMLRTRPENLDGVVDVGVPGGVGHPQAHDSTFGREPPHSDPAFPADDVMVMPGLVPRTGVQALAQPVPGLTGGQVEHVDLVAVPGRCPWSLSTRACREGFPRAQELHAGGARAAGPAHRWRPSVDTCTPSWTATWRARRTAGKPARRRVSARPACPRLPSWRPRSSGRPAAGKSTFLRVPNRMREVIPGGRVSGSVPLARSRDGDDRFIRRRPRQAWARTNRIQPIRTPLSVVRTAPEQLGDDDDPEHPADDGVQPAAGQDTGAPCCAGRCVV